MRNVNLRNIIFAGLLVGIGIVLTNVLSISYPPNSTIIRFGIGYLPLMLISIILGPKIGLYSALVQDVVGYIVYFWIHGYTSGPFYFGFTFNSVLYGMLPGIMARIRIRKFQLFKYINIGFLLVMFGLGVWAAINVQDIIAIIESRLDSDMNFQPWIIYSMLGIGEVGVLSILIYVIKNRNESDQSHRIIFTVMILQVLVSLILTPLYLKDLYGLPYWPQLPLRIIKTPIEIFIYSVLLIRIATAIRSFMYRDFAK